MNIYKDAYVLLRYIEKHKIIAYADLKNHFHKDDLLQLLNTLYSEHAIFVDRFYADAHGRKGISGESKICCTDAGKTYVEVRRAQNRDRWFTRLIAIWGGITGTAAIIVEVVLHFL